MGASGPGRCAHPASTDSECWKKLRAFAGQLPRLQPVTPPADGGSLRAARASIARTVREMQAFADALWACVFSEDPPVAGSTRAIGWSVVRLCRGFTQHWALACWVTPSQVVEYNHDVERLRTTLDALTAA